MRHLLVVLLLTLTACADQASRDADPLGGTGPLGEADGYLPVGQTVSPFDDDLPAVENLDPDLLAAVQLAATAARADGVELRITSGWRSTRYQQALLDDAIATYGPVEARKRVATPERGKHVTGDAVDIGPTDAADWLGRHGDDHGLCQTYANEMWHYELATEPGGTCPPQHSDATAS
jgi:hypothetical protein